MLRSMILVGSLVGITSGFAQDSNPILPAPEMKQFAAFTGSWAGTTTRAGASPDRAAGTFRILHGGHWMRADLNLERDYDATLMVGWNSTEKSFQAHIFESSHPTQVLARGTFNRGSFVIETPSGGSSGIRWTLQVVSGKVNELILVRESRSNSGWVRDGVTTFRKPERGEGGGMTLPRS